VPPKRRWIGHALFRLEVFPQGHFTALPQARDFGCLKECKLHFLLGATLTN